MNIVNEYLLYESNDLKEKFEKASKLGKGTSQEIADFREIHFQALIKKFFPTPYRTTKGKIIDSFNKTSASLDCLVLNPMHPHTEVLAKFELIFAEGVDVAIEVKPNIQDTSELVRGLKQIISVKKLKRSSSALSNKDVSDCMKDWASTIPTFLYTMKAKSDINKTIYEIHDYYVKNNTPLKEQFDFIVIHDKGILSNYKCPELNTISNKTVKNRTGWIFEPWEEYTLAKFIAYLNVFNFGQLKTSPFVLLPYLTDIEVKGKLIRIDAADDFYK
ncbi:DUF6602 domain-containing protein [Paenisporosarcina sp. FSL H8-0542]|uniref:DUF6602 domain-containing protein n=1 Tax=Paenisporosarcina sp. FSL H8-0542 TaxID=2921401 RepID=UPI00315B1A78